MKLSTITESITLGPFEGDPTEEFQAVNIFKDGRLIGRMNFGMKRGYGEIQDVSLSRGNRAMGIVYPAIEQRLKAAGATKIKLNTTDDAVGTKVWEPLGFVLVGNVGPVTKVWEKQI